MQEEDVKLTDRQLKQQEREETQQGRVNAEKLLKAEYRKIEKSPAFVDTLAKLKSFADYHAKVAKDGVGFELDSDGQQKIVRLNHEQRVSELDKAAGIEEVLDYLTRKLTIDISTKKEKSNA